MSRKSYSHRPGTDLVNNPVDQNHHNYDTDANVTTGAYVQMIASTSDDISRLDIYDTGGNALELAIGAAASEVVIAYIPPGGSENTLIQIAKGSRISVKAVETATTSGILILNAYN